MFYIPKLWLTSQHKFVKTLNRLLNELLKPSPQLPLDDHFDDKTHKAVVRFKQQYGLYPVNGVVDIPTWRAIGRALGKERLRQEVRATNEPELRALLLGMTVLAVSTFYTSEMEACDKKIATIVGGGNAIAAANGFEPEGLEDLGFPRAYYRGDTIEQGKIAPGHLSNDAMHLYGSKDGTRFGVNGSVDTDVYVPDGFTRPDEARRQVPTPGSARVSFFYKNLGSQQNVTLVVDHVANFRLARRGERWHIGRTGGRGGETPKYRHAHFEIYKGDVGLALVYVKGKFDKNATEAKRKTLRIPFARVFCASRTG